MPVDSISSVSDIKGIKGWLLFFIIFFCLVFPSFPLLYFDSGMPSFDNNPYGLIKFYLDVFVGILSLISGVLLIFKHFRALLFVKLFLYTFLASSLIRHYFEEIIFDSNISIFFARSIGSIILFFIFYFYFKKSVRIKNTYQQNF